jgi:acyl-CoA synthetase (AMP-forming)/AMP-acid ligase II
VSGFNLADLFERVVDELGDERRALSSGGTGLATTHLTYAQLEERSNRLANHLSHEGVGAEDHVGVHLHNRAEYLECTLAAFKLRAVPINLNHRYTAHELAHVLREGAMVAVVTEADLRPVVEEAGAGTDGLHAMLACDDDYDAALASSSGHRPSADGRSGDDLSILFTGGTTGMPKGVMWRHEDLFFAALGGRGAPRQGIPALEDPSQAGVWARRGLGIDVRMPLCPMMHGLGNWTALTALLTGGRCVIDRDRSLDAATALRLASEERVEFLMVIGDAIARPLVDALRSHPSAYDLSALRMISSSGAVLSPTVRAELAELLPEVHVGNRFGSSETAGQGRVLDADGDRGTKLLVDDDTTVLDDDLRPVVPGTGQVGRLARKGRIPIGYWNDPERTATTFPVVDGTRWSVPGDLASVGADGTIDLLGRGTTVINTGGEKVFPEEVESAVKEHPAVYDALAVGVPDDKFGQQVTVVISTRAGVDAPGLEDLQTTCRQRLAGYKVPRAVVAVPEIRRTAVGKGDYLWALSIAQGH